MCSGLEAKQKNQSQIWAQPFSLCSAPQGALQVQAEEIPTKIKDLSFWCGRMRAGQGQARTLRGVKGNWGRVRQDQCPCNDIPIHIPHDLSLSHQGASEESPSKQGLSTKEQSHILSTACLEITGQESTLPIPFAQFLPIPFAQTRLSLERAN